MLVAAGSYGAAIHAFGVGNKAARDMVLATLWNFLTLLPKREASAAAAELVERNAVELVVGHLGETGGDPRGAGVLLLTRFSAAPQGRERICVKEVLARLMKWLAAFLLQVRNTVVCGKW
jgi:hypothetical protein